MADTLKIATINTGGTWGRILAWLAAGTEAAGFQVELLKLGGELRRPLRALAYGIACIRARRNA